MAFWDFLKPKWQRSDPQSRIAGIAQLRDRAVLADLADNDPDSSVRDAASRRQDELRPALPDSLKSSSFMAEVVDVNLADAKTLVLRTDVLPHNASEPFRTLYGQASARYRNAEYAEAEELFIEAVVSEGTTASERRLATYAGLLAANKYGEQCVIPREFQNNPEVCGNVFLAVTIASHLIRDGHRAIAWGEERWNVIAEVMGNFYHLKYSSVDGTFMNSGDWLNEPKKIGLFEAAKSTQGKGPNAYVLALFQDLTRSQSPVALTDIKERKEPVTTCVRCGQSPSTEWHCTQCDAIYCENCVVTATNRRRMYRIESRGMNVLDATDDGSRPTCPKCGTNVRELKMGNSGPRTKGKAKKHKAHKFPANSAKAQSASLRPPIPEGGIAHQGSGTKKGEMGIKYTEQLVNLMIGAVGQHNPKHWMTKARVAEKLDTKSFRLRIEVRNKDASLVAYKVFDELDDLAKTLAKPYHWLGNSDYPRFDIGLQDQDGNLIVLFKVTEDDQDKDVAFVVKMSLGSSYKL